MGLVVWMLLWGCGESATFEEVEAPEEAEVQAEEGPSGSEKAPELQAPVDARPDEVVVKEEAARPQPGQAWPPIVVPQGQREREWEWDFKHKGTTKRAKEKRQEAAKAEATLEDITAVELQRQAAIDKGKDPDKL